MSSNKLIVTVSVTGSFGDRKTPFLPITPKEIADSAVEAQRAGASVAHIHVRDEATGMPAMKFELYEEVVKRLRDRTDLILNLSTGAGARFVPNDKDPTVTGPGTTLALPEKRLEHVLRLQPEICSLDVGSMNFGAHVFVNTTPQVEWMAEQITDAGVKPELEVFDVGHIEIAKHLLATGRIRRPPLFQLCMGIRWGIPATPGNMVLMRDALPPDAVWAGFGIGALAFPMLVQAFLLGGNLRIGMEDTLHLAKGQRAASNRELVDKAVQLTGLLGGEPATPAEARTMLQLKR
jgi:uncharacterized protein (DUF849 family)